MSQASVRRLGASSVEQDFDQALDALPKLLSTAATQYVRLLRRGIGLAGSFLPAGLADDLSGLSSLAAKSNDCCAVPTQDCPPRCVAEVCWEGCLGETQHATVTVKNTGTQARGFTFAATPLGPAQPQVQPASAQLAPGQSVAVQVTVPTHEGFNPGATYSGELTIHGAYEQCVQLKLKIATPQTASVCVDQGDLPQHVTELKWYRHWQCVEPCDAGRTPPTQPPPTQPPPGSVGVKG